jgi:oxygen-independent coproporphyrinogen-3 oxidase
VHVPFCRRKCFYCDFYSLPRRSLIPAYIEALGLEATLYTDLPGPVDTVYVGGGTPSLLDPEQFKALFDALYHSFDVGPNAEITIEANPEGLDRSYLRELRGLGVNRLSLGVQSLDDKVLEFLGRGHRVNHVVGAVTWARNEGFDNLGLDLIYGVPGQNLSAWREMLLRVLDLNPEHMSLYQLTFEPHTPLGRKQARGLIRSYGDEEQRDFFLETAGIMQEAGFLHYEVSNFARHETYMSRHNSKYWLHQPYLGLGPSAHSFDGARRWWNHASVKRYVQEVQGSRKPEAGSEILDRDALQLEALYFGFRTTMGLDIEAFLDCYGLDLISHPDGLLKRLEKLGWVTLHEGRLIPTVEGMVRADALPLLW